jgi:hypothetical protein
VGNATTVEADDAAPAKWTGGIIATVGASGGGSQRRRWRGAGRGGRRRTAAGSAAEAKDKRGRATTYGDRHPAVVDRHGCHL